jgi:hypothetical protein
LAFIGETTQAKQITDGLLRERPSDTLLNGLDVPVIRATIEMRRGNASQALNILEGAKAYEFGSRAGFLQNYVRGLAYLQAHKPESAAAEFQSVLDHRGVSPIDLLWVLSQLGLARASVMVGDTRKGRAAYQDFFTFWKDADPDVPILKLAKAEYAELK